MLNKNGDLSDPYRSFIAKSRYAKWREEEGRRETWVETVDRYMNFMIEHLKENNDYTPDVYTASRVRDYILQQKALPSMRALMTAGPALKRNNIAGYNCSYVAIDDRRAFGEVLYILMNGTGVGFSAEEKYTSQLPFIDNDFVREGHIVVEDSKEGWADAFQTLIDLLWNGFVPTWDVSKVRPAGAKLKTFGGRASGPEPLVELFQFTIDKFLGAAGRRLTPMEVHDIVCEIASVVVVGGVRRSALISLGDLDNDEMRHSKSDDWWEDNPQRALSNNSAVYDEKPSREIFDREWKALVDSGSGERGIFNRNAARLQAAKNGRRKADEDFGTNPCCVSPDTIIMTSEGPREIQSLHGTAFVAVVDGKEYPATRGSWISGRGNIFRLKTAAGYEIELTEDHRILTSNRGWLEAKNLIIGDKIMINNHGTQSWPGTGNFGEGYLLGSFKGDGNFINPRPGSGGEVKLWKHDYSPSQAAEMLSYAERISHRSDWNGWGEAKEYYRMSIGKLPLEFGMDWNMKNVTRQIELASSEFQRGFLRGWMDSDGHIEGSQQKSFSARLGSNDYEGLLSAQRMFLRFGIKSRIFKQADDGQTMLPDGTGGSRMYSTKATWRLVISSSDLVAFEEQIGFSHERKAARLAEICSSVDFYSKPFSTEFVSLDFVREGEVWDAEVDEVHAFDANGIYAHNSEIILRKNQFCNLTTVVIRQEDNFFDIVNKVEVATILGTWQATLTNFAGIRDIWKKNTEEERLLGVSMTGPLSNALLNCGVSKETTESVLRQLRDIAVETNRKEAGKIGIPQAAAVTCIKPEGTSSQLTLTSSGLHAWHDSFYLRTVRGSKNDPLTQFMTDAGFYVEDDVMNKEKTAVFYFPIKAPEGSITRNELDAIKHLDLWLTYQRNWCEHKPSVTVYVKPEEWEIVGNWVYENFDEVSGVAFMPHSEHTYKQAPYQEITESEYNEWLAKVPVDIDWSLLSAYESEDNTTGSQELNCAAGNCEVVDLIQTV